MGTYQIRRLWEAPVDGLAELILVWQAEGAYLGTGWLRGPAGGGVGRRIA
jgi:hypothetical protein